MLYPIFGLVELTVWGGGRPVTSKQVIPICVLWETGGVVQEDLNLGDQRKLPRGKDV